MQIHFIGLMFVLEGRPDFSHRRDREDTHDGTVDVLWRRARCRALRRVSSAGRGSILLSMKVAAQGDDHFR